MQRKNVFFIAVLCMTPLCLTAYFIEPKLCKVPVGVNSRLKIKDHQMTSSSQYSQAYSPEKARLDGNGAWCPGLAAEGSLQPQRRAWLQVNLLVSHFICQFGVQGHPNEDKWVKLYQVSYSMDGKFWKKEDYFSTGNKDRSHERLSKSAVIRVAKYVRFSTLSGGDFYHKYPCMRVELYGAKVWDFQSSFIISSHGTFIPVKPNGGEKLTANHQRIESVDVEVEINTGRVQDENLVHYLSNNQHIFIDLPPDPSSISPGNEVLMEISDARYLSGKVTAVHGRDLYEIRRSDNGKTEVMNRAYLRQKGGKPCDMDNQCPTETHCKNDELHRPAKYYCVCKKGFIEAVKDDSVILEGKCIDIDECRKGLEKCPKASRCTNSPGSFHCSCLSGYVKSHDGRDCVDVNECTLSPSPCSAGFSCHNSPGSFKCRDIDECLSSPCWEEELCVNTKGGFRCEIPPTSEASKKKITTNKPTQLTRRTTRQPTTWPVTSIYPTQGIPQEMVNGAHAPNHLATFLFLTLLYALL